MVFDAYKKDLKKGTRQLAIVAQTHYRRRKDA